jgi:hypothetical protein
MVRLPPLLPLGTPVLDCLEAEDVAFLLFLLASTPYSRGGMMAIYNRRVRNSNRVVGKEKIRKLLIKKDKKGK